MEKYICPFWKNNYQRLLHVGLRSVTILACLICQLTHAQLACLPGNAATLAVCANGKVFAGTQTDVGATYSWFRNADLLEGPLAGNGGAISFGYDVYASPQAGQYTIERRAGNGTVTCAFNTNVVLIPLPQPQLITGAGILCGGQRTLTLNSSEINVGYQLIRNGNINVGSEVYGTGNALTLGNVTLAGTYTVKAQKTDCFGNSFVIFGNETITATPALVINYTNTTSANTSWTGSGNHIIEYGIAGFTPGTGAAAGTNGTIINTSATNYTISGLAPGTRYVAYVRQSCGTGNYTSNAAATTFSTDCGTINSFPYTEGFETGTGSALPVCLKAADYNADNIIDAGIQSSNARSGSRCGMIDGPDLLILPKFNLSGSKRFRYFARAVGSSGICKVRISTTNNSLNSFSTILLTDTVSPGNYLEKTVSLENYTGAVYLALEGSAGKTILIDDFIVESTPNCIGASFVAPVSASNTGCFISWQGAGNFLLEYGLPGFTPGTGSTAGIGGTVISNATSVARINGLAPATAYDIYIRRSCGVANFSTNSARLQLITFVSCTAAITLNECSNTIASFTAGNGVVNFEDLYPYNATGFLAPGKEMIYSFTPATTGVYYIETAAGAGSAINYYYKSGTCNDKNWTPVGRITYGSKTPMGMLNAGTTYYLLLDREATSAGSQSFKICRATVNAPVATNRCVGTISINNKIPAYSAKEEYVIDSAGNLVAALDFSACSEAPGALNISYLVNSNGTRRDLFNKEYLDRSLTITASNAVNSPVKLKFFYTNAELQALIDEPNDGIADVSSMANLNITQIAKDCASNELDGATVFIPQQSSTVYSPAAGYVSFIAPGLSTFYLHGGTAALNQEKDTVVICPGTNTSFSIKNAGAGYTYQWQVNTGSGYVDIANDAIYAGSNSTMLTLLSPPVTYYGYRYRCVATDGTNTVNSAAQFLRFQVVWNGVMDNEFSNPSNYSCGVAPNQDIDVVIPFVITRFPAVRFNGSCRSLSIQPGASITLRPGVAVNITGY